MNITPTHSPAPGYPALAAMAVFAALSLSSCPEQRRDAQPLAGAPLPPQTADNPQAGAKPLPSPGDTLKPEELPAGTAFAGHTADGNTLYLTPDDALITLRADGTVVDVATQIIAGEAPPAQGKQILGREYMPPTSP